MSKELVIVNTGCANISSVKYAFDRLGANVTVTDDHSLIKSADKVLLPGVGSASAAMKSIKAKQLDIVIKELTQPVLGICLGMQLLARQSNETPGSHSGATTDTVPCLDLIPTDIERMQVGNLVLPHMGWNQIQPDPESPLFDGIDNNSYFYFVHSFCAPESDFTLATCNYGGMFSASIAKDNFYGVQFHPERSGEAGAKLLNNFIEMSL